MTRRGSLSMAAMLTVVGLIVAAIGIVILIAAGVDFPAIPPGLVILLVAAVVVALAPWWWSPAVGVVVGVFLLIGAVVSDSLDRLGDLDELGEFAGTAVQLVGLILAVVAGTIATMVGRGREAKR